ncbi:MAG: tetratricopeptide repeat protein [Planctomycetes bacterium]|nr:tetratricopeptide repeat protein [Planctomycetota bacterium]
MESDIALEVDVEELLRRETVTAADFAEMRRELYRSEPAQRAFLRMLDQKFPASSTDAAARWRRGLGLMAAGKVDLARDLLEEARNPLARYLLGRDTLDRDEPLRAKEILAEVCGPDQPAEHVVAYAEALARLDEVDELARVVESFRARDPRGADCAFLEGRLQEVMGDYAAAVASYERAVSIQPDHQGARFRLAFRLDLMGRDQEAIAHYERLKQVFPVPVGVLMNLGLLYEDHARYEKAASYYALARDGGAANAELYAGDAVASLDMFYDEEKERKDDKRALILKIPVSDFELSVRSRNCLARMNIRLLGDLIRKTEAELLSFKNFGETSLNEIKEILRSKGLRLGMQDEDDDRRGPGRRYRELDRDSVRSRGVAELDLSVRSRKALDTLNISTVGQLVEVTEEQLLECKNFGQTSLNEIKKKLADLDLSLRG